MREHSLRLVYSNPHPKNQRGTYLRKQRVHAKNRKNKSTNENAGTDKNRIRIEAKVSMAYSELLSDDDNGTPYRLIQDQSSIHTSTHETDILSEGARQCEHTHPDYKRSSGFTYRPQP
jgi:hypothetical protein